MTYVSNYKKKYENKAVGYEVEYNTLRAEILQNHKNCLQILAFATTGTGVIIGYAFKAKATDNAEAWMFMLPLLILIPSLYLYLGQVAATFRMGAYIRFFLESKHECKRLNFETRWFHYRGDHPGHWNHYDGDGKKVFLFIYDNEGYLVFWSLIFLCLALSLPLLGFCNLSDYSISFALLAIDIATIWLLFHSWDYSQKVVYKMDLYEKKWKEADEKMNTI